MTGKLYQKIYQGNIYIKENYIKQINDTREWQKKKMWENVWKESVVTTQGRRNVEESRHSFAR